jgi:hypothetical protein
MPNKSARSAVDRNFERWLYSAPPMQNEQTIRVTVTLTPKEFLYIAQEAKREGEEIGTYASIMMSLGVNTYQNQQEPD